MGTMAAWGTPGIETNFQNEQGEECGSVVWCVEMLRISNLILVMGRAESNEPKWRNDFPIEMVRVVGMPSQIILDGSDPLPSIGQQMRDEFSTRLHQHVSKLLERDQVVAAEMRKLVEGGGSGEAEAMAVSSDDAQRSGGPGGG